MGDGVHMQRAIGGMVGAIIFLCAPNDRYLASLENAPNGGYFASRPSSTATIRDSQRGVPRSGWNATVSTRATVRARRRRPSAGKPTCWRALPHQRR